MKYLGWTLFLTPIVVALGFTIYSAGIHNTLLAFGIVVAYALTLISMAVGLALIEKHT